MNNNKNSEDKYLINLSDILSLLRRGKKKILLCIVLVGLFGALYALTKPIRYRAEGTFREKSPKSGHVTGLAQALFNEGGGTNESEAISLMKSRKLIKEVINKLNLQGKICAKGDQEGVFSRIKSNLKIEWFRFKKSLNPVLNDISCSLKLNSIKYEGEIPLIFKVRVIDSNRYEIFENKEKKGEGSFNEPFDHPMYSFTIQKEVKELPAHEYHLVLYPISDAAVEVNKHLEVEISKNDKGILKLSYENRDRKHASHFINTLMETYQAFLKNRQDRMGVLQIDYLLKRRDATTAELEKLLINHENVMIKELSLVGVADAEAELEFLNASKHRMKDQLVALELEIKRLKEIQPNNYAFFDRYVNSGGSDIAINEILKEMRSLKQQRDGFELALRKNPQVNSAELEKSFQEQLSELKQILQYKKDISTAQTTLNQDLEPTSLALLNDDRYLIKSWFKRLKDIPAIDQESKNKTKIQFLLYLENLQHLFHVYEKILQERLAHQQKSTDEYQGINPITAKDLYLDFCKQLSEEEAEMRRTEFFLNHLEDPNFEISSLSAVLTDPVSTEMITKASRIVLNLKDENNQSAREQARLKDDLNLQRTFLKLHLEQMLQLKNLNKKLFEEKIYALQNINLELIHQEISLLERNFHDYVQARLENLGQESLVLQDHLKVIHEEMSRLPRIRTAEDLIDHQVEVNQLILAEVAKVVESKNIANNLEIIQSAPIDDSLPPLHPLSPGLFTFTILGSFLGGIVGCALSLGKALNNGVDASVENLKKLGKHVSGVLSTSREFLSNDLLTDRDLNTLRRVQTYFDLEKSSHASAQRLLLVEGEGPDYSDQLANLLTKKGLKVLVIDLDFDRIPTQPGKGLLQYLQGTLSSVPIDHNQWDHLSAGGVTRFSLELLTSNKFKGLMNNLSQSYDWIIAVSHTLPLSVEAESLSTLFKNIVVTIKDEKLEDLSLYLNLSENLDTKISFILT